MGCFLVGIGPQVHDIRKGRNKPNASGHIALDHGETDFPFVRAHGIEFAAPAEVEDGLARAGLGLAFEEREEVVAVGMDLPRLPVRRIPGLKPLDNAGDARGR